MVLRPTRERGEAVTRPANPSPARRITSRPRPRVLIKNDVRRRDKWCAQRPKWCARPGKMMCAAGKWCARHFGCNGRPWENDVRVDVRLGVRVDVRASGRGAALQRIDGLSRIAARRNAFA